MPGFAQKKAAARLPALKPTPWAGFFEVLSGHWVEVEPLLKTKAVYVQDPSTRIAVDVLAPRPDETVLDLCAAPGGKTLLIADRMKKGKLVAFDLPGQGMERLRENLAGASGVAIGVVEGDILREGPAVLRRRKLPERYGAVLLDAPVQTPGSCATGSM